MVFSIQEAVKNFRGTATELKAVQEQLAQLQEALAVHETILRDDSLLAWQFACNKLHPTWRFQDVVFELLLMRFLYEHTAYPEILSHVIAGVQPVDVKLLQDWIIPVTKIKVLQQHPGGLPEKWPWVGKKTATTDAFSWRPN